jgi:hypothetical protein
VFHAQFLGLIGGETSWFAVFLAASAFSRKSALTAIAGGC